MTCERLISEAELARLADERGNAYSKLCAETEPDRRQHRALNDDVSNAHLSALASPLRLYAHEKTREDVVSEEEVSVIRTKRPRIIESDLAGLLGKRASRRDVRAKC